MKRRNTQRKEIAFRAKRVKPPIRIVGKLGSQEPVKRRNTQCKEIAFSREACKAADPNRR
ncbi:MAG: hypothetical protein IK077_07975 [Thermoguttaceae bacterium]|nr:hypothetical protein [Thermoguttaceae bacterium]